MSNKLLGYIKEKELTHDDVIAMIDKHLQRVITEEGEPDGDDEVVEDDIIEESDNSTSNDEVEENDEIEQFSQSQKKKMEELDEYISDKKKEVDKYIKRIKRKEPPSGDISSEALTNNQKIKANWFEVDV